MKINKNQAAFASGSSRSQDGLTKLEYFAAAALQGILANTYTSSYNHEMVIEAVNIAEILIDKLNERVSDEIK